MKKGWIKLIVFLLTAVALASAVGYTLRVKDAALEDMVNSVQFALVRVEAQQVVNQVEYGLKYGKQLEFYFDIDNLLQGIHLSSSYLKGVYLTDAGGSTLYSTTGTALPDTLWPLLRPAADGGYDTCSVQDITYISLDIGGVEGDTAGRLIMKVDTSAMRYLVESRQEEGRMQSIIVGAYALALCTILLARLPMRDAKGLFRPMACALAICLTVLCSLGLDLGLETIKSRQEIALNVTRSAQRMGQILQQEIDSVVAKGVGYDDIYSLETYFYENARSIPSVDSFRLDLNNRVVAVPSQDYIAQSISNALSSYLQAWGHVALCLLPAPVAALIWRHVQRRGKKGAGTAQTAERNKDTI